MADSPDILTDTLGRKHTYLRISLIERCNLRCTYCMPEEGVLLSPKSHLMTADEIAFIAQEFVRYGITKIRLTGGEPLLRKDIKDIMKKLSGLPARLTLTTNGVLADRYLSTFRVCGVQEINLSLDSLDSTRNHLLTRRNYLDKVYQNMLLLLREGFTVKINCVLIRGINDAELIGFIRLGKDFPLEIRFVEFMPFSGNKWDIKKCVPLSEVLEKARAVFGSGNVLRLQARPNDTSKRYKIDGYRGSFAVISTVSAPFCNTCNRIRLTANGCIKNCLFSTSETNILAALRRGDPIAPIVRKVVVAKKPMRNGMNTPEDFQNMEKHKGNRSMTAIGG